MCSGFVQYFRLSFDQLPGWLEEFYAAATPVCDFWQVLQNIFVHIPAHEGVVQLSQPVNAEMIASYAARALRARRSVCLYRSSARFMWWPRNSGQQNLSPEMSDHQPHFWSDIPIMLRRLCRCFWTHMGLNGLAMPQVIKRLCMTPACFGVVGYIDQNPAGFIMLQQAGESADIIEICVRTAVQNTGIGRQLLEQALSCARARCLTKVLLEVAVTNQPALNLYRSAGFVLVGKRPHYYHQKQEKLMRW